LSLKNSLSFSLNLSLYLSLFLTISLPLFLSTLQVGLHFNSLPYYSYPLLQYCPFYYLSLPPKHSCLSLSPSHSLSPFKHSCLIPSLLLPPSLSLLPLSHLAFFPLILSFLCNDHQYFSLFSHTLSLSLSVLPQTLLSLPLSFSLSCCPPLKHSCLSLSPSLSPSLSLTHHI